jgi:hypothetical protein
LPLLFAIVVSPFLVDALRVSPETKKAQPISQLGRFVVCGGMDTAAYRLTSNDNVSPTSLFHRMIWNMLKHITEPPSAGLQSSLSAHFIRAMIGVLCLLEG